MPSSRRFPRPWSAEVTPNCFIVRDANGQALSYVYYESEPGRRSAAKLLSNDEARRMAAVACPGTENGAGKQLSLLFSGFSLQPPNYHTAGVRFRVFAISEHFDPACFDPLGINDN